MEYYSLIKMVQANRLSSGLVIDADCPVYASIRYNAGSAGALVSKGDASWNSFQNRNDDKWKSE